jgi:hypothetical protein
VAPNHRAPLAPPGRSPALLALALALGGCSNLDRFTTAPGEAYCGAITLGSPFRTGLSPRVQMRLTLDASALDGASPPGVVSTYEAPDVGTPEQRMLVEAALRPIPPLAHDALSHLDFGDGRERNAIYAVSPADPEAESILAVLSLRTDETVEVRLLRGGVAPSPTAPTPDARRPIFGLFSLTRQPNRCGF